MRSFHERAANLGLEVVRTSGRRSRITPTTSVKVTISGDPERISDFQETFSGAWGEDDLLIAPAIRAAQFHYRRRQRRRAARRIR